MGDSTGTRAGITTLGSPTLNNTAIVPATTDLAKSMSARDARAYNENPWRMLEASGFKEKPTSLSYNILYQMSVRNSVVAAVLNTRVNQVSTFTKPARFSRDGVGYCIGLRDPKATPSDSQMEIIKALELFLENCGFNNDNNRDDFDTFIRKTVRDSLTYDQMCFEIVPDRRGRPSELLAVDAATIRSASERFEPGSTLYSRAYTPSDNDVVKWVQVIDGSVVSWFSANELAFGVRNPRTNINMQPYGFSELEMLIQQITAHLYAEEYNEKYFSQGGTTKGIINLKSDPNGISNKEQLESFKRQWRAQVNGMTGSWKTPVLQVPDGVEYISVNQSNRDMEYSQWVNYLINIVCAVYQIDPAEVNFSNNGGAAGQSSVFETSEEQKLKNSRDKGLKPLLRFVESMVNKFIISRFSQEYVFSFTGMDEHTDRERAELQSHQSRVSRTVNEIRAENGDKPIPDGDVILDPAWLSYHQQKAMQDAAVNDPGMGGIPDSAPVSMGNGAPEEDNAGYTEQTKDSTNGTTAEPSYEPSGTNGTAEHSALLEQAQSDMSKSMSQLIISVDE